MNMIHAQHLSTVNYITPIPIARLRMAAERYAFITATIIVCLAVICSGIRIVSGRSAPAPGSIKVVVHPGESIWTYAVKYGNPDEYILKRVHRIAAINKLEPGRPLEVGQKLVIPVERPTMSAKAPTALQ